MAARTQYLSSPYQIRAALQDRLSTANKLSMAVAFIGRDWDGIINRIDLPMRVVCWLSSPTPTRMQ